MKFEQTDERVRRELLEIFTAVDSWFDIEPQTRAYLPKSGWSINQVLEHIALTNHFLILTLDKQILIAEKRAQKTPIPDGESDLDRLIPIGERGSFEWERPDHMEPTRAVNPAETREVLSGQVDHCLNSLDRIKGGIGALVSITMTVNDLGKIDLYQWIFFIAKHAQRHLQQMEAIQLEQKS
ncbi:DinB family protein [Mariniblastus sp.]|nr:DinB family protein [Mariniblastus sp.]